MAKVKEGGTLAAQSGKGQLRDETPKQMSARPYTPSKDKQVLVPPNNGMLLSSEMTEL